jgi:hypothetical protein
VTAPTPATPTVPPHEVTVTSGGGAQIAGENYTLTCQVTGGGTMTPTYRWFRDGSPLTGQTSATLSFSPLREIDSGVYTCEGTRNSITVTSGTGIMITVAGELILSNYYFLICTLSAPTLSAVITTSGSPNEGQSYSLTCAVSGDELLAPTDRKFQWDRVGGMEGISREPDGTLTFNPLSPSDAGEYMCTSSFLSPYLTGRQTVTRRDTVMVNRKSHIVFHKPMTNAIYNHACNRCSTWFSEQPTSYHT